MFNLFLRIHRSEIMLSLKQGWAQIPGCWTFQLVLATEAPAPAAGTRCRRLGCAARGAFPCRSSGKHSSCTATYRNIFMGVLSPGGVLVCNLDKIYCHSPFFSHQVLSLGKWDVSGSSSFIYFLASFTVKWEQR